MERRLLLAKELLNPDDSVLIVTIDEKEYLRLGLLLEQMFPEAQIQMVSIVINPQGVARAGEFSRVDEYIFFVLRWAAQLSPSASDMLDDGTRRRLHMPDSCAGDVSYVGANRARRRSPESVLSDLRRSETGRIASRSAIHSPMASIATQCRRRQVQRRYLCRSARRHRNDAGD